MAEAEIDNTKMVHASSLMNEIFSNIMNQRMTLFESAYKHYDEEPEKTRALMRIIVEECQRATDQVKEFYPEYAELWDELLEEVKAGEENDTQN
jgi:hypothetical protein